MTTRDWPGEPTSITTDSKNADMGGNTVTNEESATTAWESEPGEPVVRAQLDASGRRYGWLLERTRRLLPAVEYFVREDYALPELTVVHLTTRLRMVRAVGRARAHEDALNPAPGAIAACMFDAIPDGDLAVCTPLAGPAEVFININRGPTRAKEKETELGALLAKGLTLAALLTDPDRGRSFGRFRSRSRFADDQLVDLWLARLEAEESAAQCAAETWRHRNNWAEPLAKRARGVLDLLTAGVIEADQPYGNHVPAGLSAWAEATVRRVYDAAAPESDDLGPTGLAGLKALVSEYGTDTGVDGESLEADRHRRLCAAAWCDFMALIGTQNSGTEEGAWHDDAVLLGWHLRDFDARHATSRGEIPAGHLEWERSGRARHYTRQEWAAAHHTDQA
jgi:hypothetical protein